MKRLSLAIAMSLALIGATHAATYTYTCRDGHKAYPVTLDTGSKDDCEGAKTSCRITWRGTTFRNAKLGGEGCRSRYIATAMGVTVDLCMAAQGVADLKIGDETFNCQMRP